MFHEIGMGQVDLPLVKREAKIKPSYALSQLFCDGEGLILDPWENNT
jgi:hypothetical protein